MSLKLANVLRKCNQQKSFTVAISCSLPSISSLVYFGSANLSYLHESSCFNINKTQHQTFVPKRWSSKIRHHGPIDPPEHLTFGKVNDRVLKAILQWDRFPQDRKDLLNMTTDFGKDLGLDSLDHVEIILSIEIEFGYEIADEDAFKMKKPEDIAKYIYEREGVYE